MKIKYWRGIGAFILLFSPIVEAQRESGHFRDERQQQDDQRFIQQQQWLRQHQYQAESATHLSSKLSEICLPYTELRFRGINALDHRPFIPQKGSCLNESLLNKISRDLTVAYLKEGILHTPFQFETTSQNQLVMVVKEGRLRHTESDSKRLNMETLLPNLTGRVLKVQDLDQALDQANKMRGSRVTVDVHPSSNGDIALRFVNQEQRRVRANVGLNNFAAKAYHRWQTRVGVSADSPLGLSDSLYLTMAHTLNGFSQYSRSTSFYYSLPYGYWSVNAFTSLAQFRQKITLPSQQIAQQGRTIQAGIGVDYVAARGSNFITTLSGQLERLDSKVRFGDAVLFLQSPTLSAYQLGINHLQLFPNGAVSMNVAYKHGLPWFNALPNQGRDQPEGQYGKWLGELYFQYYHQWFGKIFKQSHRLQGQYSDNYLVGAEQADLTGRYAVRGLNDIGISAEKSLVVRNQFEWILRWNHLSWSPYVAVDIGAVKTSEENASSQRAWGYALGVNLEQSDVWNAQLEWSRGRLKLNNHMSAIRNKNLDFVIEVTF